eukprot:1037666-Prymnesium_polylepis.2
MLPEKINAMSKAEVHTALRVEGLTLLPSDNKSGFKYVGIDRYGRFIAKVSGEHVTCLGTFDTALEAALQVARHLGPAASAAAAAPPPAAMTDAE